MTGAAELVEGRYSKLSKQLKFLSAVRTLVHSWVTVQQSYVLLILFCTALSIHRCHRVQQNSQGISLFTAKLTMIVS